MTERYYGTARLEIMPHLPARVSRMLDVGCGVGATVAAVKERRAVEWAGGVEIVASEAERAKAVCDAVWSTNIEQDRTEEGIPAGSLDLILCLDVLEHLVDPWTVVDRLSTRLSPEGRLIVSVPNIRNWKFIKNLLFKGDFRYRDAGLLDRTHLRFFVRDTARELAEHGGLQARHVGNAHPWRGADMRRILSAATFGGLDDVMVKQWLIVAEPRRAT